MSRENQPITNLIGLLLGFTLDGRKTMALVKYSRGDTDASSTAELIEHFDAGGGCSGNYSTETTMIEMGVFEEALREGCIRGATRPGYISTTEFVLSGNGLDKLSEYHDERRRKRVAEATAAHVPEANNDH